MVKYVLRTSTGCVGSTTKAHLLLEVWEGFPGQLQVRALRCFGNGQVMETREGEGFGKCTQGNGQRCQRGEEGKNSWPLPSLSPRFRQTNKQVNSKYSAKCDGSGVCDPDWGCTWDPIKVTEISVFPLTLGDQKDGLLRKPYTGVCLGAQYH